MQRIKFLFSLFVIYPLLGQVNDTTLFEGIDNSELKSLNRGEYLGQIDSNKGIVLSDSATINSYIRFSLNHKENSMKWQLRASVTIFITVIIIVSCGLILSILHFIQGLRNQEGEINELEIGKGGLKIKSSVIGLIILCISLTFLYVYLNYAFEIREF